MVGGSGDNLILDFCVVGWNRDGQGIAAFRKGHAGIAECEVRQDTVAVCDVGFVAIGAFVQRQLNGFRSAGTAAREAGDGAVRHRNGVQNAVVAALEVCTQHGVNIAVQSVVRARFDVRIVAAVGNDLPDQYLRSRVLHLAAVAVIHLRVAEGQDFLNVTALKVIQFQLPIGGAAGFVGSVGGVVLPTQGRGVR